MDHRTYWRTQRRRIALLLGIWFVAGPLMSILFIDQLNELVVLGMPLGFWMAQQGSILIFVVLIFVYAVWAGVLDRRAGVAEDSSSGPSGTGDAAGASSAGGASGSESPGSDAATEGTSNE